MRLSKITLGLFIACLVAAGCTRKNDIVIPPEFPIGGKGGKATLRITPRHHGKNIDSCVIRLAYDANNFSNKPWDEVKLVTMVDNKPTAIFDSLAPGHYFIYAEGYDPLSELTNGPVDVYGSGPFTVLDSNGKYEIYMDVNEHIDHIHTPHN
jgi:hypothetical protein